MGFRVSTSRLDLKLCFHSGSGDRLGLGVGSVTNQI